MSIIYEALKKVQKNITGQTSPVAKPEKCLEPDSGQTTPTRQRTETSLIKESPTWPGDIPPPGSLKSTKVISSVNRSVNRSRNSKIRSETTRNHVSKSKKILYVLSLLSLLLICGLLFSLQLQQSQQTPVAHNITPTRITLPSMRTTPAGIQSKIVISGIMSTEDKNLALINNNIHEAGDMIGDIKIVEITADSVRILDNGEVKILKVQFKN